MSAAKPTFYPPRPAGWARALAKVILPPLRWRLGLSHPELPDDDARRLREACGGAALLCANHPSLHEPVVLYDTLRRLEVRAHYLSAIDTMEIAGPLRPWMQGIGVYSIRRAAADREAMAQTRKLLTEGQPIAVFPEGETYGLNDVLLPFHEGVVQMGLWGVQDRVAADLGPTVRLVPIAIKYVYQQPMEPAIDQALGRLEQRLGVSDAGGDRYDRLRNVGLACARVIEAERDVAVAANASLDEHIDAIYDQLLGRLAGALEVDIAREGTLQDKLRRLYTTLLSELNPRGGEDASDYERRLQQEREPVLRSLERDLARLQTFQAVRDGYVAARPTAERYLDVLGRLEREVMGHGRIYGLRRPLVRVGEPIDLAEHWERYRQDRRGVVPELTTALRGRVEALLAGMVDAAPLIEPARAQG